MCAAVIAAMCTGAQAATVKVVTAKSATARELYGAEKLREALAGVQTSHGERILVAVRPAPELAEWDLRQRMEAAVRQEETLLLRMLASAGFNRREIEHEQQILSLRHERVWGRYFDSIMSTPSNRLPFFQKLGRFVSGEIAELYTPLVLTSDEERYEYPKL